RSWFHFLGVILMFRSATGPWSPWIISGPVAASLPVRPPGVTPWVISTFSWITWSLNVTLTNFALATFLSPWNFGAWKSMTYFCHSPGFLHAFTFGAALL